MSIKYDIFWVLSGRVVTGLIGLVAIRAVTTYLSPEQYGELALLLTIQMFCGLFLINPIDQHINLYIHTWWKNSTFFYRMKTYKKYVFMVSIIGAMIAAVINARSAPLQLFLTSVSMLVMIIAATWQGTMIWTLNMLGYRRASVFWSVVSATIALTASVLLANFKPSANAWFAGQALGIGVGALGAKLILQKYAEKFSNAPSFIPPAVLIDKHTVFSYCVPLAMATCLMWVQLHGYRILIEYYWGLTQLGFLMVGLLLAGQIWALVEALVTQFLYPLFYDRVNLYANTTQIEQTFSDLLNTLIPLYIALTGFCIACAGCLLQVLAGSKFHDATTFLMLGTGIEMCRVIGNILSIGAHVKRATKLLNIPYVIGAIIMILFLILAGEKQMNITSAGIGILVGAVSMLFSMAYIIYQEIKFSIDLPRISASVIATVAMILVADLLPAPSSMQLNLLMIIMTGIFAGIVIALLLWKNPAVINFISLKIRKN